MLWLEITRPVSSKSMKKKFYTVTAFGYNILSYSEKSPQNSLYASGYARHCVRSRVLSLRKLHAIIQCMVNQEIRTQPQPATGAIIGTYSHYPVKESCRLKSWEIVLHFKLKISMQNPFKFIIHEGLRFSWAKQKNTEYKG